MSAQPLPTPRRIVTGHNTLGQAIVAIDDRPPIAPRPGASEAEASKLRAAVFWSTSTFPNDNSTFVDPVTLSTHVGHSVKGGSVLRIGDFGPGLSSPLHRTISLDYAILLAGENMEIELDNGVCVKLEVGDVVVQRGTIHAWHNRGTKWARFAFVLMDAEPVKVGARELPAVAP